MTILHGDCISVMAAMDPESVDAICTDPPYGLEFMGKEWDKFGRETGNGYQEKPRMNEAEGFGGYRQRPNFYTAGRAYQDWCTTWAEAAYRVAKPSAYLLAFGGTRTVHRMTVALEDAGWIIRDMLVWGYASGFPKSKASLKPAWEPIVMARKPGPLRMLAIDECRIGPPMTDAEMARSGKSTNGAIYGDFESVVDWKRDGREPAGRWPANIILTDPIFDGGVEGVVGGGETTSGNLDRSRITAPNLTYGAAPAERTGVYEQDSGTYSRFFQLPRRYNRVCQECGHVSTAGHPSSQPNRSDGSAPSHAQTGAFDESSTTTDSPTTSETAIASLSDDAANTPSILRSKRRGTSPGSEPESSPAKSPDAVSPETGTTTTTAVPWTCGTCAEVTTLAITSPSPGARNYPFAFLIPKSARSDREPVLGGLPEQVVNLQTPEDMTRPSSVLGGQADRVRRGLPVTNPRQNVHPTVKPTDLMRHLIRLVTPTGGTVLDPFLGSGTTALAAEMEGFAWVGIEREAEYVRIAEARLNGTQRGLGLDVGAPTPKMPNTHPDLSKHQPKQRAAGENYSGRWSGTPPKDEDAA
jgi:DNA modification methylase